MNCPNCKRNVRKGISMCPYCGMFFDDGSQKGLADGTGKRKLPLIPMILVCAVLIVGLLFAFRVICIHDWTEADCISPKTCEKCGRTEGEPLGHTDLTAADCLSPAVCKTCGSTVGEPLGHTWVEASYAEPKTCSTCLITEGQPLLTQLTEALRERLPVVTYAMSTKNKIYGYTDSQLSKKSSEYHFYPSGEEIVIMDISEDGTAMRVRYPSTITESGYRTMWFPAEEIVCLETIDIRSIRAENETETLRYSFVNKEMKHYGTMAASNKYLALGTHATGYTAIVYDIDDRYKFDLNIGEKLALIENAP